MTTKEAPTIQKSEADRKKEWLNEVITVEFFNIEEAGVPIKFSFGPTRKPEKYTLLHGGKYPLRREVIQHIESRQTPIWGYKPNGMGQMEKTLKGYKSRFQCKQLFE